MSLATASLFVDPDTSVPSSQKSAFGLCAEPDIQFWGCDVQLWLANHWTSIEIHTSLELI